MSYYMALFGGFQFISISLGYPLQDICCDGVSFTDSYFE